MLRGGGGTSISSGYPVSGGTAGCILYVDSSGNLKANDANLTYDATNIRLTVGTGSGAAAGWTLGNGANGYGFIWGTAVGTLSGTNYSLYADATTTELNSPSSPLILSVANVTKVSISGTAGAGPAITAGTAVTDVAALSITRTNNNAAVATGVDINITDTLSAAGYIPFQIRNGATNLFKMDKTGNLTINATTGTNADFLCLSSGGVVLLQTTACTISSLRFKEKVRQYSDGALDIIRKLNPITFKMKNADKPNADWNYDKPQVGLAAENVACILPLAAIYEQDGVTPKSYRQESIIAVLAKGMQELMARLEKVEARV